MIVLLDEMDEMKFVLEVELNVLVSCGESRLTGHWPMGSAILPVRYAHTEDTESRFPTIIFL